ASGNHATLPCVRRPRVGILATGDELRLPGSALEAGQIIASNSYGVGAVLASYGGDIIDLGIAADSRDALNEKLDAALAAQCDVIITLGGASVGDHDLVKPVFEARGMTLDFWKIAMRPGKPLMSGRFGDVLMIGLPGNPVSSMVCAHVFCAPVVAALAGRKHAVRQEIAQLTAPLGTNGPREHYMRAIATRGDKALAVDVFDNQDSSVLSLFAKANCLVIRPPHDPQRAAGQPVTIQWIKSPD
ncbi:MAG: molybdopterin molybdotransferase MoeA, partial [Ahrensia sp.]